MNTSIYLFTGVEIGLKEEAIKELQKKIEKKSSSVDFYNFYAGETKVSDVISLLMNGGLFSDSKFVVLRNAEVIKKKEEIELFSEWVKTADSNSILVLTSDSNSVDKKLEAIVPKENKKIFWEMFQNKKEEWVRNYFRKEGFSISEDAILLILEMTENNIDALKKACASFFLVFEKGSCISEDDILRFMSHNKEESAFTLFDAISGDGSSADRLTAGLDILQKLSLSKDSSFVALIAGLSYCFRKLKLWHSLVDEGYVDPFELKKNGFSSTKVQEKNRKASRLWTNEDCQRILALLAKTDVSIRSGGTSVEENFLQLMLYSIVMKKGSDIEEYIVDSL